jgi:hypothetical protein
MTHRPGHAASAPRRGAARGGDALATAACRGVAGGTDEVKALARQVEAINGRDTGAGAHLVAADDILLFDVAPRAASRAGRDRAFLQQPVREGRRVAHDGRERRGAGRRRHARHRDYDWVLSGKVGDATG